MGLGQIVRSITPPHFRARMRRWPMVNRALRMTCGGIRSRPHPQAPYDIYFDGYRNLGWMFGGLTLAETPAFEFCREMFARIPCRCAWDVGANIGMWSLFLAGIKPRIDRIICFEPDPANLTLLRMNQEKNGVTQMELRERALSSTPGTMTFYSDPLTGATGSLEEGKNFIGTWYGAARRPFSVVVSTVDEQLREGLPPPDFIKIDVEGHELEVLRGARDLFTRQRPLLMIEVDRNPADVGELLKQWGYKMIHLHTRTWTQMPGYLTGGIHESMASVVADLVTSPPNASI